MLVRRNDEATRTRTDGAECPSRGRPIDLVHLARQTLGDRSLEREIMVLMLRQIEQCAARLDLATDADRGRLAHSIKGAARNVGAFALAERSQALEDAPGDADASRAMLAEMRRAASFIATLLD
jgi:HPt (histidine-containing phosphotransfer) domain-containing protein